VGEQPFFENISFPDGGFIPVKVKKGVTGLESVRTENFLHQEGAVVASAFADFCVVANSTYLVFGYGVSVTPDGLKNGVLNAGYERDFRLKAFLYGSGILLQTPLIHQKFEVDAVLLRNRGVAVESKQQDPDGADPEKDCCKKSFIQVGAKNCTHKNKIICGDVYCIK
jgi:hypothetical protein